MVKLFVITAAIFFQFVLALPAARKDFVWRRNAANPLIVGGQEALPNEFPFMVSIQYRELETYKHMCGASIINERWVVSASHCTEGVLVSSTRILAGEHSFSTTSGFEQYSEVDYFVMHPKYDNVTYENDIALIRLTTPLNLTSDKVSPINLPAMNQQTDPGTNTTVIGWGNLEFNNYDRPDVLYKVTIPTVSDSECRRVYPTDMFDSCICAGVPEGGLDSCNGDSGGPLFTTGDPMQLIGIVYGGKDCALPGYYGIYTEVSYFVDWIISTITAN